jgi:hypothetical protein
MKEKNSSKKIKKEVEKLTSSLLEVSFDNTVKITTFIASYKKICTG